MSRSSTQQLASLPPDKVRERLKTCAGYYASKFQDGYQGIHMDLRLLRHSVELALLELKNFKEYHGIKYADRHKRAAFLMYWISHIKPIQIESNANFTPALGVVNEIFAIHLGLNHLDMSPNDLPDEYLPHLIFALHRRDMDCANLAREMFLLEKASA